MAKRILVLSGNPKAVSFSGQLAEAYKDAAQRGHEVRIHRLADMAFDPDLDAGYASDKHLEPDLAAFQDSVRWADHLLITTPVWWGALPAKLKGVFDRTFLPGFAFKYQKGKLIPDKLLTFCGFARVSSNMLGPVISSDAARREQWLRMVGRLGAEGK